MKREGAESGGCMIVICRKKWTLADLHTYQNIS